MENSSTSKWLYDINLIKPGSSAVFGQNFVAFYLVHSTGLITTGISVIASVIVIVNIISNRSSKKWDFSDRFPLYLAISDGLWGVINLTTDHVILLVYQVYPTKEIATIISAILSIFLGYQQVMNAGLAVFTYCKVVRHTHIDFGFAEWKLHSICVTIILAITAIFLPLGGFGCSGYWFVTDITTAIGRWFQVFISFLGTFLAICTYWSYRAIKNAVDKQRRIVVFVNLYEGKNGSLHLSTATQCLTTFIYVSLFLYTPLIVVLWVYTLMIVFNSTVDPFTAFFIVILCNSSGWANMWAYFHNKKIKKIGKLKNTCSFHPSVNKHENHLVKFAKKSKSEF